jgi:hypothetical protein
LDDEKNLRKASQNFFVSRWLFSTFLLNAIIHPEVDCSACVSFIADTHRRTALW